jgi:hypothetical protein
VSKITNCLYLLNILKLARLVQSYGHTNEQQFSSSKEFKMYANVSSKLAAAVAAIFSAAVFIGASVGPAVNNGASLIS